MKCELSRRAVLIPLSFLLGSCAAHHSPVYRGWGEWVPSGVSDVDSSLTSVVDWSTVPGVITSIDGNTVGDGYKKARLLPGKHQLEYADNPAEFGAHPRGFLEVDLLADHVYEFRIDYCFWCSPRRLATWVDDKTTGDLIWGNRPDWPSWWL